MTTLDELVDYCNEEKPVGALLLTGEWGCGKTYFIEHVLKERIIEYAVILRVSLFGMTSVDEINEAVKKAWIELYSGFAHSLFDEKSKVRQILNAIGSADSAPEGLKALVSIDFTAFIPLKNKIITNEKGKDKLEKKVILVFDDLERCNMDYSDVLGVINDYCENKEFHTIIVANEDKIKSNGDAPKTENTTDDDANTASNKSIPYSELKEKVIGRSIRYSPDYKAIVDAVIKEFDEIHKNTDYFNFLTSCKEDINNIFAPSVEFTEETGETRRRPHNIRSLKCALYDFLRIYCLLQVRISQDIATKTIKRLLLNFIIYVLMRKSDFIKDEVIWESEILKVYPSFEWRFLLDSEKEWIDNGNWREDDFIGELDVLIEATSDDPLKILKYNPIIYVDDNIVQERFPKLLECAYKGELSLDDYVNLIINSASSRYYNFILPEKIDWDKVDKGVTLQFERLLSSGGTRFLHTGIKNTTLDIYEPKELELYKRIDDFDRNGATLELNRRMYIEEIKLNTRVAFNHLENKRLAVFDLEMADATFQAYKTADNYEKPYIDSIFGTMWKGVLGGQQDFKSSESVEGFEHLKDCLVQYKSELDTQQMQIAAYHVNKFIETVDELLQKTKEKLEIKTETQNQ